VEPNQKQNAGRLKEALATYRKAEDLINIGAYVAGSSPRIDHAIKMIDRINGYLRQDIAERVSFAESVAQLQALFDAG
jgi:flagellum-specific ATP synthase